MILSNKINRQQINEIKEKANENLALIFDLLNIPSEVGYGGEIRCACPIHEGDNQTSFCYNIDKGFWACYTNLCHENGGNDIVGLVQKILSKNKETSFYDALLWLKEKLSIDGELSQTNDEFSELDKIVYKTKIATRINKKPEIKKKVKEFPFDVSLIKDKIEPSKYFLEQGFSEAILRKYMVGYCDNPHKPMYLRSYAPVLDTSGTKVIGVTGRIQLEKCQLCHQYHIQGKGCPIDNPNIKVWSKWFHYGFATNSVLYNDWNANSIIRDTKKAIIVERYKKCVVA